MKLLCGILLSAVLLVALVINQRHFLLYHSARLTGGSPPPLLEPAPELPSTIWFDDYYTIDEIAPDTYAIGETRYYQQVFNYLVVGEHTALLFDAGPGLHDIHPVIASLTDLPVTFLPSHFHYDHVGNGIDFERRAVVDLPYLRERAQGNVLSFETMEHLGPIEGFPVPTWQIDEWWAPGQTIDLGGRGVTIIHTPGHSRESISLFDNANNLILSGDYLYEGMLYVFVPGSSLQDYLTTAASLLESFAETDVYYGAHRTTPPGAPKLSKADLQDLHQALLDLQQGKLQGIGVWPKTFQVNDRISIVADPEFLQDWD